MSEPVIRIAVAEDQSLFRDCLVDRLNEFSNFKIVLQAANGRELLNQLDKNELPDIVLMDLNMPEMNGMETTRQLRNDYPTIKIIILSVYAEPQHIAAMVKEGVNGYIVKNSLFAEVREAIRNVYLNDFYFNPDLLQTMQTGMIQKKLRTGTLDNMDMLTTREKEVLQLICREFTAAEIGEKLFISKRTVEGHRNNLLLKTGCRNTAGLVLYAINNNLFSAETIHFKFLKQLFSMPL